MIIILFIIGLFLGSFINVLALRYQTSHRLFDKNVRLGRSECPACHHVLAWRDLIPILSFVILRGHCRYCRVKISWRYPITEIMTGLILSLLYWQLSDFYAFSMPILDSNFYFSAEGGLDFKFLIFIIWSLIFLTLWLIALIDLKTMLIPNGLVLFLSALGALKLFVNDYGLRIKDTGSFLNEYSYLFGDFSSNWLNYFLTALGAFLIFFLLVVLTKEKGFGMGDVKLIASLGLIFGWPDLLIILNLAFISGTIFALYLILAKKRSIKDMVPFGPFLSFGAFIFTIFGYQIFEKFFRWFGAILM